MTKLVIWTYDVLAWLEDNQKYIYGMHDNNDVNDIVECNLLHNMLNTSTYVKVKRYHYSPIVHGYINTHTVK